VTTLGVTKKFENASPPNFFPSRKYHFLQRQKQFDNKKEYLQANIGSGQSYKSTHDD
jgi:hypothetical protein